MVTGVGVLDKAVAILDALEDGPLALGGLVEATGMPRATAHRLAQALERHGLLDHGESVIGNVRLEHKLRRRRTGGGNGNVARRRRNLGNVRHQLKQQCFIVGCNVAHLAGRCRPDRTSVGLRRNR